MSAPSNTLTRPKGVLRNTLCSAEILRSGRAFERAIGTSSNISAPRLVCRLKSCYPPLLCLLEDDFATNNCPQHFRFTDVVLLLRVENVAKEKDHIGETEV